MSPGHTTGADMGGARLVNRILRVSAFAIALILAVALGVGAGYIAFRPASEVESNATSGPLTVETVAGSVGRSMPIAVTVDQPFEVVATNSLSGVVTRVGATEVEQGDVLYEVAGTPVRAIEGAIPMYRDLAFGVKGEDVAQLQRALTELGYPVVDDGTFGRHTRDAVKAWQASRGEEKTGEVAFGTVLVLPTLPTTVRLGEAIAPGLHVAGGESAVLSKTSAPRFLVLTTGEVAAQVSADSRVIITNEDETWPAVIASQRVDQNSQTELTLLGTDGGPPCADSCGALPPDDMISLSGVLVITPDQSGVVVPIAAVQADAGGATSVVREDGTRVPVTVIASQDGRALVEGVTPGERLRVAEPIS